MGREAEAQIEFAGQNGFGKILLEANELILRGEIRARIARKTITGFTTEGDDLVVVTAEGALRVNLGAKQAALWQQALAKPPPSLGTKLGISSLTPARVIGRVTDPALIAVLHGVTTTDSMLILAEVSDQTCFDNVLEVLQNLSAPTFWGVTAKGKSAFPEANLRSQMRAAGFIDSKSCAISDLHSATRFSRKTNSSR